MPKDCAFAPANKRQATNVIDLVSVLQESLPEVEKQIRGVKGRRGCKSREPLKRKKAA